MPARVWTNPISGDLWWGGVGWGGARPLEAATVHLKTVMQRGTGLQQRQMELCVSVPETMS